MQGSWAVLFRIRTLSVPRVHLQSDFNRQKRSLENFSLPLVTLWKRVWTHTQQYTTCVALIYGTQKKTKHLLGAWLEKIHRPCGPDSQLFILEYKNEVKVLRLHLGMTLPQYKNKIKLLLAFKYKNEAKNDKSSPCVRNMIMTCQSHTDS